MESPRKQPQPQPYTHTPQPPAPLDLAGLPGALPMAAGFPRPDWNVVRKWVEGNRIGEQRTAAVRDAKRQWLEALARHMGGEYRLHETEKVMIFSEDGPRPTTKLAEFLEDALTVIHDALEGVAPPARLGVLPVLAVTDEDDYRRYLSHFYRDPAQLAPLASSAAIRTGAVHVVLSGPASYGRRALARELSRLGLARLPLPAWVEEGVAQVLARVALDEKPPVVDVVGWGHHRSFWQYHGLDGFWSGAWFARPEPEQTLARQLAECLVRMMNEEDHEKFNDFLRHARREDAGRGAAEQHFGQGLPAFAVKFLGEGF